MKFSALQALLAAQFAGHVFATGCTSPRPSIVPSPYQPRLPIPNPPPRTHVCYVQSHGDGVTDDSPYILSAFHKCNNGGHVVFRPQPQPFVIGTAMDWTFLESIDIG
jgi:galacturan 1,4-alpha-galacturonidase